MTDFFNVSEPSGCIILSNKMVVDLLFGKEIVVGAPVPGRGPLLPDSIKTLKIVRASKQHIRFNPQNDIKFELIEDDIYMTLPDPEALQHGNDFLKHFIMKVRP